MPVQHGLWIDKSALLYSDDYSLLVLVCSGENSYDGDDHNSDNEDGNSIMERMMVMTVIFTCPSHLVYETS